MQSIAMHVGTVNQSTILAVIAQSATAQEPSFFRKIKRRGFVMKLENRLVMSVLILATTSCRATGQEDLKKMSIRSLVGDLSSADGTKRVVASAELFRRGKDVLPELKNAGAKQLAPFEGSVDGTRRLDMVYSVIEGFPPNAPTYRAGYRTNSFGLHLEKGTTEEDARKIAKTHQCILVGDFTTEGRPNCYLQVGSSGMLEAVIRRILSTEPKVTTINLNAFEK